MKRNSLLIILSIACLTVTPVRQAALESVVVTSQNLRHAEKQNEEPFCNQGCTDWWYLENIEEVERRDYIVSPKPILIAVIDDGFRLTHKDIAPFIYKNPLEKPNGIDDDGNGYIDDISGWDISDQDNDVNYFEGRRDDYYHGTYITGIITNYLKKVYGDDAPSFFRIVPIKALSDYAGYTYIADGYKAMDYAEKIKADIVCTAWGANVIKPEEMGAVANLNKKGITLLASAGNFNNSMDQFPAALEGVISVAALDKKDKRIDVSNYGSWVDISAPGIEICGASVYGDDKYMSCKGTSPAVAITTALAAIIKFYKRDVSPLEIKEKLQATSTPIDEFNLRYAGRLGSGKVDLNYLISWLKEEKIAGETINPQHPKGIISLNGAAKVTLSHTIKPKGDYKYIGFKLEHITEKTKNSAVHFESTGGADTLLTFANWPVGGTYFVQGSSATLQFDPKETPKNFKAKISYNVEPIDSTLLFCNETVYLYDEQGIIEDGSGTGNYTSNASCKWQITAEEGKHIYLEFLELDTEKGMDNILIFDGQSTIPENMLARLSGNTLPPAFNTGTNKVLIWFITDGQNTAKGWRVAYRVE